MEYNFSKYSVGCMNRFLDTVNEQIVDVDITLPDYCPDIEKILKCTLIPKVYTRCVSGGQLTVDGVSVVRILYCDSIRHNIRCFTQTVPFSANFGLKTTPENYLVLCDTKCEYINCRALSPRKMVIHGAFSLSAKVLAREQLDFYSYDEDSDLRTKKSEIVVSDLGAICQEQFSVTEDIVISNKPPVETLLTYEVISNITDLKSIHNKIMLNAEITLKAMYISDLDTGDIEHISYVFPVSRIIDCDNVNDETVNVASLEVMSYDLQVKNEHLDDGSKLTLDVKMCFSELGYTPEKLSVVEDVYSTKFLTESKHSIINCETGHRVESFTHIAKSVVKLDGVDIACVLDVYSESAGVLPVVSDGMLTLSGKVCVCVLLKDKDNTPLYVERNIEIDYKPPIDSSFDRVSLISCVVNSISFRLVNSSEIELRVELRNTVQLCDTITKNCVVSVTSDEEKPIKKDDSSLILYYADKGESLWDIAKKYSVCKECLMIENDIDAQTVDNATMILVPTE